MSTPQLLFVTASTTDGNAPLVTGVSVTGTGTYYSKVITGFNRTSLSGVISWTGTPTGTFVLQYSDKLVPDETNDTDWTADTSTFTAPAGSAGSTPFASTAAPSLPAFRHRIKYTNASGTGVITGFAHAPRNG